ncbi:hypothetical protein [Bradyrhizobium sp. USDA 4473]
MPRVSRNLVALERIALGVERLHFGGEFPGHLRRDFERLSSNGHTGT